MNKSGLIATLVEKYSISEEDAGKVVDFIFKNFTEELGSGGRIEIRRFGIFM